MDCERWIPQKKNIELNQSSIVEKNNIKQEPWLFDFWSSNRVSDVLSWVCYAELTSIKCITKKMTADMYIKKYGQLKDLPLNLRGGIFVYIISFDSIPIQTHILLHIVEVDTGAD